MSGSIKRTKSNLLVSGLPTGMSKEQKITLLNTLESMNEPFSGTYEEAYNKANTFTKGFEDKYSGYAESSSTDSRKALDNPSTEEKSILQQHMGDFKGGLDATIHGAVPLLTAEIVSTPLTQGLNKVLGTNFENPADGMTALLEKVGIKVPSNKTEQLVSNLSEALLTSMIPIGAGSAMQTGKGLAETATKTIGKQLAANAPEQLTGAVTGTAASLGGQELAKNLGASETAQNIAGITGGILGDVVGSKMARGPANISRALKETMPTAKTDLLETTKPYGDLNTSELTPPAKQSSSIMQNVREGIPGGAGETQFARQAERVDNVKKVMSDYGVEVGELGNIPIKSKEILTDFLDTRSERLTGFVDAKKDVISRLSDGPVDVTSATAFLDDALADVGKRDTAISNRLASKIVEWKGALEGKDLDTLEKTRRDLFDELKTENNADILKQGTQILNEAYGEVVESMGDYIKKNGDAKDFTQWKSSNASISKMTKDFKDKAIATLLQEGEKNPDNIRFEDVDNLLFSGTKSDMTKLLGGLSTKGKGMVKTALISKFAANADPTDLSPARFGKSLQEYGESMGIAFDKTEVKRFEGLKKYLDATKRAEQVTRSAKGYTGLPTGELQGSGTAISMGIRSNPLVGLLLSGASTAGLGKASRLYEETPAIRNLLAQLAEVDTGSKSAVEIIKNLNKVIVREQQTAEAIEKQNNNTPREEK